MNGVLRDPKLHAVLGAVAVTIGFWLAAGAVPVEVLAAVALGVAGFLVRQGTTLGRVWAWASLLIGLDSLAWPIVTMVQIGRVTEQPDDQQMGVILTAVVAGLFASVFWLSFSWGIFRWVTRKETDAAGATDSRRPQKQPQERR
jgi:hypothetical protein